MPRVGVGGGGGVGSKVSSARMKTHGRSRGPANDAVHAARPGTRNQTPNPGSNAARAVHHRVNPNPNVEHRKRSSTAEVERAAQEVVETAARCVLL